MKKSVSFKNTDLDQAIWNFTETKMNFSIYVKELILKDMEKYKRDNEDIQSKQEVYQPVTTYTQDISIKETSDDDNISIEW